MNNISATINIKTKKLQLAVAPAKSNARPTYFCLDLPKEAFDPINFEVVFGAQFKDFLSTNNCMPANFSFILPDEMVAIDIISLPTFSKSKMIESVNLEFSNLYKNNDELDAICTPISSNKQRTSFLFALTKKTVTEEIKKSLFAYKFNSVVITFEGNALNNGIYAIDPLHKKQNFVGIKLNETTSVVSFSQNEMTVGFAFLPFGLNLLAKTSIVDTSTLPIYQRIVSENDDLVSKLKIVYPKSDMPMEYVIEQNLDIKEQMSLEDVVAKNFEVFVKAGLNYLTAKNLTQESFSVAQIILPKQFGFLADKFEQEKIKFLIAESDADDQTLQNIILFGGLQCKLYNKELVF